MGDDDLIAGMQMAVKKEVIETYLHERRIIEEELQLLFEDVLAWHGGVAAWERRAAELWAVALGGEAAQALCKAAGMEPPDAAPPARHYPRPRAFGLCASYLALVERLYRELCASAAELEKERAAALALREEVNRDILHFEATHDMLAICSYLCSLDPAELQRRKILGNNFTASERACSAEALSFKPVSLERLELDRPGPKPAPARKVLTKVRRQLKQACRENRQAIGELFRRRGRSKGQPSGTSS